MVCEKLASAGMIFVEVPIGIALGGFVMPSLPPPTVDPTPIFEHFRGSYGSELLTAAVAHFDVFGFLTSKPCEMAALQSHLQLADRPFVVLTTALRAMGLLEVNDEGVADLTPMAREHLSPGGEFDVSDYIGLAATSPGVLEMVERLQTNRPQDIDGEGAAFIYRAGQKSAMEQSTLAEHFTLALSGRAKNVAPVLAERVDLSGAKTLLDVGGGTGIYSIAFLKANPQLRAIVIDRPEVLNTAKEFVAQHPDVAGRIELLPGDMFADALPNADAVLLSNILHDWHVEQCEELVHRCAMVLNPGGRLLIHDVLLNDAHDGPLPIALYSAALFTLTEGRAYSAAEYQSWLRNEGLKVHAPVATLVHCHVVAGRKG